MAVQVYPSDLTDAEWAVLSALLPPGKPGGRPRSVDVRRILNGLFYLVRAGCAWRYLPREYGPWSTVYHYFRQFRRDGTWERVHAQLRELARQRVGREPTPSAAIIDSQSIRTHQGGPRGFDGALRQWTREHIGRTLEVVYPWWRHLKRYFPDLLDDSGYQPGFNVIPRRWVVERTISWLGRARRLSKDYERLPVSSEALIYLTCIRLLLVRLA